MHWFSSIMCYTYYDDKIDFWCRTFVKTIVNKIFLHLFQATDFSAYCYSISNRNLCEFYYFEKKMFVLFVKILPRQTVKTNDNINLLYCVVILLGLFYSFSSLFWQIYKCAAARLKSQTYVCGTREKGLSISG